MERNENHLKSDLLTFNQIKDYNFIPSYVKELGFDYDPLENNKQFIEIFGYFPEQYLDVIKKYGFNSSPTDFAMFNNCNMREDYFTSEGNNLENRAGFYYTKSFSGKGDIMCAAPDYISYEPGPIGGWGVGIRPCFIYSEISPYVFDKKTLDSGVTIGKISRYPKNITNKELTKELLSMKHYNELKLSGNAFTINKAYAKNLDFLMKTPEYFFDNRYFVYATNQNHVMGKYMGTNGELYKYGDKAFIEVEPIEILIDEKANIAICKNILIGNIPVWHNEEDINNGLTYEESYIPLFLNNYLTKDIEQGMQKKLVIK